MELWSFAAGLFTGSLATAIGLQAYWSHYLTNREAVQAEIERQAAVVPEVDADGWLII